MLDKQIFAGVKILAATRVIAAPFSTYQLAMHGADVLNVENPKEPDSMRYSGDDGTELKKQGMGCGYLAQNSNKKSMTLNLAVPQGQEIFKRLAKESDIVVENLIAGTMPRYGLGYEDLKKINPKLIYCSITGFGQTGPKARAAAIDGAIQAASGIMSVTGTPESGPLKVGFTMVDYATGYAAAVAMISALYHRAMTGEGQNIDVAMLDAALTMTSAYTTRASITGYLQPRAGNGSGHGGYVTDTFKCKENDVTIAASTEQRRQKLWKAIGRTDIPLDPRFCTPEVTRQNYPAMRAEIEKTLATKTALEWEEILADGGVAAMAVRDHAQAISHPQIIHRGLLHHFGRDEELGLDITVPKAAYQFSETPAHLRTPPPRFGQHTEDVLKGLGFGPADIQEMRKTGIV